MHSFFFIQYEGEKKRLNSTWEQLKTDRKPTQTYATHKDYLKGLDTLMYLICGENAHDALKMRDMEIIEIYTFITIKEEIDQIKYKVDNADS